MLTKKKGQGIFRSKDGICAYKCLENTPIVFQAKNRNLISKEIIIDPQELINKNAFTDTIRLVLHEDIYYKSAPQFSSIPAEKPEVKKKITESELSREINIDHIYFERTKPTVLQESYTSIDKLANIMKERPRLYIKILGHTDNVGDKLALQILSDQRADAIKSLLIDRGVQDYRVDTEGFGDLYPLAPNDSEENKSKNRRVEIKIISQ